MQQHFISRCRKPALALAAAAVATLSLLGSKTAQGSLTLEVFNSSATAGGSGSFDIAFTDSGGGDVVGTFNLDVSVPGASGVTFTAANTGTNPSVDPYVFGSIQSPPFTLSGFPNTHFFAGDTDEAFPFETTFNDGDVFGAAAVTYSVAPGTPTGQVPVTLGVNTSVGDASGGPVDFSIQNGTIDITGAPSGHPILSLTSAAPIQYGNKITNGASAADKGAFTGPGAGSSVLSVTGHNGSYQTAQVTGIGVLGFGDATNYVEANGFTPAGDDEIYAMDVLVNGTQASPSQLATLIDQINTFDGGLAAGLSVSSTLTQDPFPSQYNLFLTASPGVAADDFLGFDVSNSNDSNLVDYSISAVAVVPEPISIGITGLASLGLLRRRRMRKV